MARNRKRAKERRARRPQSASVAAAARVSREAAPDPIEHASPDVELAEAQLALGRPELAAEPAGQPGGAEEEFELEPDGEAGGLGGAGGGSARGSDGEGGGGELAVPGPAVPEPRARPASRLINFLQGSWRELQRVQWPDRRQVMQATGVVIGFVIVAGVFLGVADAIAAKLVNFILK